MNGKSFEKSVTSDLNQKISLDKINKREPLGDISQNFTNGSLNNI